MLEDAPFDLISPGRRPLGVAPVLVPFGQGGDGIDWDGFAHLLGMAAESGLLPAVNTGPGAGDLLGSSERAEVLATTGAALGGRAFVAGVKAEADADGGLDPARLAGAVDAVSRHGGTPALLPSPALARLDPDEVLGLLAWMGEWCNQLLAVDLPADRWPGGRPFGLDQFTALLDQPSCIGLIDGSWNRQLEWDRIRRRDDERPGFRLFSANPQGIDQIIYGADHALDLAAVVPDALADRDDAWAGDDPGVVDRNDALQALATIIFRPPLDASRHALARALLLRGWLGHDRVHPALPRRPASDDELLLGALDRLGVLP